MNLTLLKKKKYNYFNKMVPKLDVNDNPYYKNIMIPTIKIGNSELKYERYKPYEGFVCNDIVQTKEGRQIPQIIYGMKFRMESTCI
jgi:hypothetical protein